MRDLYLRELCPEDIALVKIIMKTITNKSQNGVLFFGDFRGKSINPLKSGSNYFKI